jgi:hypothetical protein
MSDTAVHLTKHVLPEVPLRQWVCSLPWGLRIACGYDRELCADVVNAFVEELMRSLRWRAKRELGLASVDDAHPGAITFIQRFDSALRLNAHAHTLALDGVYVQSSDAAAELTFHALSEPTDDDVIALAQRTAEHVAVILAPNASLRSEVVSSARLSKSAAAKPAAEVPQLALFGGDDDAEPGGSRKPWSWLLAHVFSIDVTRCSECGGEMKWVEIATTPEAIAAGLARDGLGARAPPRKNMAPLGQLTLGFSS